MKIDGLTIEDMHEELAGTGEFPEKFNIVKCAYCGTDDSYIVEWTDENDKRRHDKAVSDLDDADTARRSFNTYPDAKYAIAWFNDSDDGVNCVCQCLDEKDTKLTISKLKSENARFELIPAI